MTKFRTLLAAALVAASSTVAFASSENGVDLYLNNSSMIEGRNSAETVAPKAENDAGIHAFSATAGRIVTEGRNSAVYQAPVTEVDVRRF